MFKRFVNNPLITPSDIQPLCEHSEVVGSFNAGVSYYQDEFILLLRIAERPKSTKEYVAAWEVIDDELVIRKFNRRDQSFDFGDPRLIKSINNLDGFIALTSLSYLRVARSENGIDFIIDEEPFMFPNAENNSMGIEDARITQIKNNYFITYTQVSPYGVSVGLSKTTDFKSHEYLGTILAPENKNVVLFPEKIQNKYYVLHRPILKSIGGLNIWLAESDNLVQWGNHKYLLGTRTDYYDEERVGAGAPPIKTARGWLVLYHGATTNHMYSTGAVLLDSDDPSIVIGRTTTPIIKPERDYEKKGFFGDVVFVTGTVKKNAELYVYYGASDTVIAGGTLKISDVLEQIERESVDDA